MIYVVRAKCSVCGKPVQVTESDRGTADLYIDFGNTTNRPQFEVICKNVQWCADPQAL